MNLNIIKNILAPFALTGLLLAGCSSWTDTRIKDADDLTNPNSDHAYFEALKAYKKSDHAVTFGWFGNWTGKGVSLENSMKGLPDSVDFVSMWGGWKSPTPEMLADLRHVQKVKGTRALVCCIVLDIGDQITPEQYNHTLEARKEFWGWVDGDDVSIEKAIRKYANAFCDTIDKYNYDGFDLDWEPNYAQPFLTKKEMAEGNRIDIFLEEMSKRVGPKSGTDRLLVIDGEPYDVQPETGKVFDYFIVQAYRSSGEADLNSRLNKVIRAFDGVLEAEEVARKFIVTENFESFAEGGGVIFDGKYRSLEGMARWNPIINGKEVRKGGVGTFHMEYEYSPDGFPLGVTYPYLRKATQIMNPANK